MQAIQFSLRTFLPNFGEILPRGFLIANGSPTKAVPEIKLSFRLAPQGSLDPTWQGPLLHNIFFERSPGLGTTNSLKVPPKDPKGGTMSLLSS